MEETTLNPVAEPMEDPALDSMMDRSRVDNANSGTSNVGFVLVVLAGAIVLGSAGLLGTPFLVAALVLAGVSAT